MKRLRPNDSTSRLVNHRALAKRPDPSTDNTTRDKDLLLEIEGSKPKEKPQPKKNGDSKSIRAKVTLIEPELPKDQIKHKPGPADRLYGIPGKLRPKQTEARSEASKHLAELPDIDYIFEIVDRQATCMLSNGIFSETEAAKALRQVLKPYKEEQEGAKKHTHLDHSQKPLKSLEEIFDAMVLKAIKMKLKEICSHSMENPLTIVTMCSGTEAPILSMQMIRESLQRHGCNDFKFVHQLSAEIETFKAAYIERNFQPPAIIRDVTDFLDDSRLPRTVYGREVQPKKHMNLLIAGSSCVDYSSLNVAPKQFGERGESWATMQGIAAYAKKYKPDAVLLENVAGAPWSDIKHYWSETIGYDVVAVKGDTKNYSLSQTRQRGYLFGINRERAKQIGLDATRALRRWVNTMVGLQQRASAAYYHSLIPRDDPEFENKRRALETGLAPPSRTLEWASCRNRYDNYRSENQLGNKRPMTNWQNNGSCNPPDYGFVGWYKKQRERILDTLDIDFLRYMMERDYDMSFKIRSLDLSQNMDRDKDSKHWGLVGCITPAGMPWDTFRSGPIFGEEALALQGIPVDSISLKNETQKQLMDLAGNAMSTTVVGAAIVAAVIAAFQPAEDDLEEAFLFTPHDNDSDHSKARLCNMVIEEDMLPKSDDLQAAWEEDGFETRTFSMEASTDYDLHQINKLAAQTRQMCLCEEFSGQSDGSISVCSECGHTACSRCRGNPMHRYVPLQYTDGKRESPSEFIRLGELAVPRSLKINAGNANNIISLLKPSSNREAKISGADEASTVASQGPGVVSYNSNKAVEELMAFDRSYQDLVWSALSEPFHFNGIRRDKAWKIVFRSPFGRLELRFSSAIQTPVTHGPSFLKSEIHECYWLIFADDMKPSSSLLRQMLKSPIAMMVPKGGLLEGTWQLFDPASRPGTVQVTGIGAPAPSWEAKLGLQDPVFKDRKEFRELQLDLDSQTCSRLGVSHSTPLTFKLLPKCGAAQGSLHRGPRRTEDGKSLFFFLDPQPLQDAKEDSYVIAITHNRMTNLESRLVLLKFPAGWRPNISDENPRSLKEPFVNVEFVDNWKDVSGMRLITTPTEEGIETLMSTSIQDVTARAQFSCATPYALLRITLPRTKDMEKLLPAGRVYSVDLVEQPKLLRDFAWALHKLEIPEYLLDWNDLASYLPKEMCHSCVPVPPLLSWMWTRNRGGTKKVIRPYPNAEAAADHEKALKARAAIATAFLYCYRNEVKIEVKVNIPALVHRSIAYLRETTTAAQHDFEARVIVTVHEPMLAKPTWNLVTIRPTGDINDKLTLPASFVRALWPAQTNTVLWMMQRESTEVDWKERDVSDAPLHALRWNVKVEASCSVTVRGGVISDDVGSGKTTTALALAATSLPRPCQSVNSSPMLEIEGGRIKSQATLIMVPKNILDQWESQMKKCFEPQCLEGPEGILIKIESVTDLCRMSLETLTKPRIILVSWSLLDTKEYYQALRRLCFAPNVPMTGGRPFEQWLSRAITKLESMILAYATSGMEKAFWNERDRLKEDITNYYRFAAFRTHENVDEQDEKVAEPDTSIGLAAAQQVFPDAIETFTKDMEKLDANHEEVLEAWNGDPTIYALLHLFCFERLIVDEFTYLQGKSFLATLQIVASKRWMISATPPLATFDGANTIARSLGTKLSTDQVNAAQLGAGTKASQFVFETSYHEDFLRWNNQTSTLKLQTQYTQGAELLLHFLRKNPVDLNGTVLEVHYEIFDFQDVELATYLEFFLFITTISFKFTQKRKRTEELSSESRGDFIQFCIEQCGSAEEALMCATSIMRMRNQIAVDGQLRAANCQDVLSAKGRELAETVDELLRALRELVAYINRVKDEDPQNNPLWGSYIESITTGGSIGDLTVCHLIDHTLCEAYSNPSEPEELLINGDKSSDDAKWVDPEDNSSSVRRREIQARVKELQILTLRLVRYARSTRCFKAVSDVKSGLPITCSKCLAPQQDYSNTTILAICGHVVCNVCLEDRLKRETRDESCPHAGCSSTISPQNQIQAAGFSNERTATHSFLGSRMDRMVDVLQQKIEIEKTNTSYVLIFVQYPTLRDHVVETLKSKGIAYEDAWQDVVGRNTKQMKVAMFRKAANRQLRELDPVTFPDSSNDDDDEHAPDYEDGKQPRVLILQLDSADAAGWNLQCISHVFFVSPLLAPSEHSWKAMMDQAVGRSLRYGQARKVIHVHHFVANRTIEVNILADRSKDFAHFVETGEATRGSALEVFEGEAEVTDGDAVGES